MLLTCQTLYLLLQIVNQAIIIIAPNNLDLAIGDICEPIRPVRTATVFKKFQGHLRLIPTNQLLTN